MTRRRPTQAARILDHLRSHPGACSWELTRDLHVVNTTGRISDLRRIGHRIECRRDDQGVDRYYLIEPQRVTTGEQIELAI